MAFSHTISLENVKQVTKDSRPPPPNFQCISYGMTQTFSCKYCKGEELLSFRESHQEIITCPTYNSDIKLLCSRDHRTRLLLSADAGENSPLTENSPWREHLRGKVVRNHSIPRSTNARHLREDVNITILSTHGMHLISTEQYL